jgi:L-arabinose isomerase
MTQPRIGLLGLYLELYDQRLPDRRPQFQAFYDRIAAELRRRGLETVSHTICRLAPEFRAAVQSFEKAGVDALVTLHLAYSPSLESCHALAATRLPILVLDTTPGFAFGLRQGPQDLMLNHGIHGVQDLCNMLLRLGKPFQIEAGHWQKSDVLDRVAGLARAAAAAAAMRAARVGCVGPAFAGMGDFAVPASTLRRVIGLTVVQASAAALRPLVPKPADPAVRAELAEDRRCFNARGVDPEAHLRSVRAGLAIRRWMQAERLTAFSANFLNVTARSPLPTVPFLEASKAMAEGKGYAGEGDALTAGLVGALARVYPDTSFTEMFCPDWKGHTVFLSHMGELNWRVVQGRPRLVDKPFPFTDTGRPAQLIGRFRGGPAVLVNLAPLAQDRFRLLVAPVRMLALRGRGGLDDSIQGWFQPTRPLPEFLAAYSRAGGTHHSALVYGNVAAELRAFGALMGWDVTDLS